MKTYELTYIISSQITQSEADESVKEVESFIQNKGGVVLRSEKPRAQTLSYPIKKQGSGYFSTLDFQIPEGDESNDNKIKEINDSIDKNNKFLRHLILIKRPFKELKGRRTRKPGFAMQRDFSKASPFIENKEKAAEKLNPEDLDKKLDEILNE